MAETILNTAQLSLNQHLNNPGLLIDNRTEQQYLDFVTGFSQLINFYSKENLKDGSWEPFLLKDPVFLLATISETDAAKSANLFKNAYTQCSGNLSQYDETDLSALNPLFSQVFNIFNMLLKWSSYMYNGTLSYKLKDDVIGEIEQVYATKFWAFADLLSELSLSPRFSGLINVGQGFTYNYETNLWSSSKHRKPYQKVLALTKPLNELTLTDLLNSLKNNGIKVIQFYKNVVSKSNAAYQNVSTQKSTYPDTLLLRTFFELLKVNQQDLNGLTQKHLAFYYGQILRQLNKKATADSVYINAELASSNSPLQIGKGTQFNAGTNANKETIIFESTSNFALNPAKIINVHTLLLHEFAQLYDPVYEKGKGPLLLDEPKPIISVLMNQHKDVGVLKKDEKGVLQAWDTFGNPNLSTNTLASLGLSFASPLLLLKEGTRTIDLVFTFSDNVEADILTRANFYLSTKTAWLPITEKLDRKHLAEGLTDTLHLTFTLDPMDPVIEKFEKNPDGYEEMWPLFKIVYQNIFDLSSPPQIKTLDITVSVEGVKSLVASNDNGALATAKPFMPFGPIVQRDGSFYIGNAEIFSKPLTFFSLNISWDKLPQNFADYYDLYNKYLDKTLANQSAESSSDTDPSNGKKSITSKIWGWIMSGWTALTKSNPVATAITTFANWLFKRSKKIIEEIKEDKEEEQEQANNGNSGVNDKADKGVFNNTSFKVDFELLSSHAWSPIKVSNEQLFVFTDGVFQSANSTNDSEETEDNAVAMFNESDGSKLCKETLFVYQKAVAKSKSNVDAENLDSTTSNEDDSDDSGQLKYDPSLQDSTMLFSEKTAGGFIRMNLTDPTQGFGFDVYPQVISQVTLINATKLIKAAKTPVLIPLKPNKNDGEETASGDNEVGDSTDIDPSVDSSISGSESNDDANSQSAKPKEPTGPLPLPNPPFAPVISALTASYQAAVTHNLDYRQEKDPIQFYHYSVFNNYLVYDNTRDCGDYQKHIGIQFCGINQHSFNLPMYAGVGLNSTTDGDVIPFEAVLYLEMVDVIVGNEVSLFIELNQSANPADRDGVILEYFYLSGSEWKTLSLISDGCKGLKCSGIMTFEFPSDMDTSNLQMSSSNYWMAITLSCKSGKINGVSDLIGKTTFLKTNGLELKRVGTEYLEDVVSPVLEPSKIVGSISPIPEIASIVQPFPSFGGKAAEDDLQKNKRVANHLKTKGRPITINDFNRFVMQDFKSIFYSKVNYEKSTRTVFIRLVKKIESEFASNAFLPMVSACEGLAVETALKDQTEIENLKIKNFEIEYVTVNATVYIQPEYDIKGASNRITQALKVFLSPWIDSSQKQVAIDQGVTDAQVASFITSFQEVSGIEDISFQLAEYDNGRKGVNSARQSNVTITDPAILLVPNKNHGIDWKKAV